MTEKFCGGLGQVFVSRAEKNDLVSGETMPQVSQRGSCLPAFEPDINKLVTIIFFDKQG